MLLENYINGRNIFLLTTLISYKIRFWIKLKHYSKLEHICNKSLSIHLFENMITKPKNNLSNFSPLPQAAEGTYALKHATSWYCIRLTPYGRLGQWKMIKNSTLPMKKSDSANFGRLGQFFCWPSRPTPQVLTQQICKR